MLEEKLEPKYEEMKAMLADNSVKYSKVEEAIDNLTGYKNVEYYRYYINQCKDLAQSTSIQSIVFAYKDYTTFANASIYTNSDKWFYIEIVDSQQGDVKQISSSQLTQELEAFVSNNHIPGENMDQIFDDDRETYKARM